MLDRALPHDADALADAYTAELHKLFSTLYTDIRNGENEHQSLAQFARGYLALKETLRKATEVSMVKGGV